MGARESVDGLHESRKLQLVHDSDSTSEISDSMAVSAVNSAMVLCLALGSGNPDPAADRCILVQAFAGIRYLMYQRLYDSST